MVICPKCEFANPDEAESCARCGDARYTIETPAVATLDATNDSTLHSDRTPMPVHPSLTFSIRAAARTAYVEAKPAPGPGADLPEPPPSAMTVRNRPTGMTVREDPPTAITAAVVQPSANTPIVPPDSAPAPPQVRVKLVVLRGLKIGAEYPIYEGRNTLGRFVDKPVDVDLLVQESIEQTWCSRVHAAVTFDKSVVLIEDLNSLNGTWINGTRIHPGQQRVLKPNDVIQIGTVQMKLVVE